MHIVISTSRGRAVKPFFIDQTHQNNIPSKFFYFPGATFGKLTIQALDIISKEKTDNNKIHIYILGGLPDVTHRLTSKPNETLYDEVTMQGNTHQNIQRITGTIYNMLQQIRLTGATVTICTIVPSSISKWNYTRLTQRKTLSLRHFGQYPDMQQTQHEVIIRINQEITTINSINHLPTPFLHRTIVTSLKVKANHEPRYKFSYVDLVDGVHPIDKLASLLANKLFHIVQRNFTHSQPQSMKKQFPSLVYTVQANNSDDEEEGSHSRSWRPS